VKQKYQDPDDTGLTLKRSGTLVTCAVGMFLAPPPFSYVFTVLTAFFFLKQIGYIAEIVKK
jgi:hypothetical protein